MNPSHICTILGAPPVSDSVCPDSGLNTYKPGYGTVVANTMDNSYEDWDTSLEGIPLYNAGNPSDNPHIAEAYVTYNCQEQILCVLVKAEPNIFIQEDESEAFIKIYDFGNNKLPFDQGFQFIYEGSCAIGWEGCMSLPSSPFNSEIEIHANWSEEECVGDFSNTASSGRTFRTNNHVCLELGCECEQVFDCGVTDTCTETSCISGECVYRRTWEWRPPRM